MKTIERFKMTSTRASCVVLLASCLGATACTGELGASLQDGSVVTAPDRVPVTPADPMKEPDVKPSNPLDPDGKGDPMVDPETGEPVVVIRPHLRRLTSSQYHNTIVAALGDHFSVEEMPQFGDDIPTIGLSNDPSLLRVSKINIDEIYKGTQRLARRSVTDTPEVAACVAASDEACFGELIDTLGGKLWRRPVTSEEKAELEALRQKVAEAPGSRAEQAEFLIQALIASPNMLYRSELGEGSGEEVVLTDYELASALSYTIWNAPPDDELLGLAAQGKLSEREVYLAQVERLISDPRVAHAMSEFYADYLKIDAIFDKTKIASLGLTPEAREALVSGMREDLNGIFAQPDARLLDPFSTTNFHVNAKSATFFGVPVVSQSFEQVAMDPTERFGVLSHPGFLSVHAGEGESGMVKRGVFTLEQLLCVHLGAPPANVMPLGDESLPKDFDESKVTSREALHIKHSSQPQCAGCHVTIDPAGYGYENYDSAGRWRLTEKENVTIDASGSLKVSEAMYGVDLDISYDDSIGYVQALGGSDALRSCVAQKFLTYVLGEVPGDVEHKVFLKSLNMSGGDVNTALKLAVTTPSFTARLKKEEGQ